MTRLPDDVTPGDIDRHFGEPETRTVHGTVEVAVTVETQFFDSDRELKEELLKAVRNNNVEDILEVHVAEVEPP